MSMSQRVSIGVAVLALTAALMWLSNWRRESDFKALYRGLDTTEAGEAVQKLRETGIEFRLADDGRTILVPSAKLDETRLALAREGLPKSGRMGFELFDKQSFGTTDFAEQVNYRRALEGELERTIGSIAEVERARVHLTFGKDSVFTEARQSAKASVLLNLRHSATLSANNVAAIAHLVANAVEGLAPNQITIVASNGELLNRPRSDGSLGSMPDGQLEYRVALERDLQNKLSQTLDPVLGFGNYRAGVSMDVDFSGVQESEETWDPDKSVIVQSQRTEESNTTPFAGGGVPGTQTNLPDGAQRPANATAGTTRKIESNTYQTSRKVRHVDQQRGFVKRITVAVLLDQEAKWEGQGAQKNLVLTPPAPAKIEVIKNLVTNVAGLNTERGDQITVESLPFESTLHQERPLDPQQQQPGNKSPQQLADRLKDPKILGGAGAGLAVIIGLVVFLLKKKSKKVTVAAGTPALAEGQTAGQLGAAEVPENLSPADLARLEQGLLESLRLPPQTINKSDTLAKYLRQEVKKDPHTAAQMLRTWLLSEER